MPVKWTPETDQILLLKILETSDVAPKCTEISEKWPTGLERPTPRAISERIVKIRATAKASGTSGHFSVPNGKSNPSTPRKKAASGVTKKATPKKATPKKANGAKAQAGKRKRGGMTSDTETSDDTESNGFKSDNNGSEVSDDETPRKKSKANTVAKGTSKDKDLVKVKSEEEESGLYDDDSSSYKYPFVEDEAVGTVDYA